MHRRSHAYFGSRIWLTSCLWLVSLVAGTVSVQAAEVTDENAKANAFFERAFTERVQASPEFAAQLGLRIRYGEWTPLTEQERERSLERTRQQLAELEQTIDRTRLSGQVLLSYDIFVRNARRSIDAHEWRHHRYGLDQMNGLQSQLPAFMINTHRVNSLADAEAYIARLRGVKQRFAEAVESMSLAEAQGAVPPRFVFPYVISDARNVITGARFTDGADRPLWADFKAKVSML